MTLKFKKKNVISFKSNFWPQTIKKIFIASQVTMGPNSNRKKRLSIHVVSMAEGGAGLKDAEPKAPNSEQV